MIQDESDNRETLNDNEIIYRSIKPLTKYFMYSSGRFYLKPSAFSHRSKEPSIDRHELCPEGAPYSKPPMFHDGDLVMVFRVSELKNETFDHWIEGKYQTSYTIQVKASPLRDNRAHGDIVAHPRITTNGAFDKMTIALATIVNSDWDRHWAIPPSKELLDEVFKKS